MQAGFLCLEAGKTRSKNSINVAAKNLADFVLAVILFWIFGFGLMFGDSYLGLFGTTEHLFGAQHTPLQISFFFFQMMFCGTAATLLSGAVAERMSFYGYAVVVTLLCSFIYPVVGHWSWASIYQPNNEGWLESIGFIDFAGSTVVHSVGGWVALSAVLIIGPRLGRFNNDAPWPVGNNLPMSVLGTLLLWVGWFGFNGGSTLSLTDKVPLILLNTSLAAAWGGLAASLVFIYKHRYFDVSMSLNGVIAGLVSITASADSVTPGESAVIGIVGGIIVYLGTALLEKLRIDDVISVIPAHLFAGIWGTLAVAGFSNLEAFGEKSRLEQFYIQGMGILVIGIFCFSVSFIALYLVNRLLPLRVTPKQELEGMNISEHRATTELIDLLSSMKIQAKEGDFANPVPVEPFTEVGQIATQYNRVINKVGEEISHRDKAIDSFRFSEKRKSAILDSSMDGIITVDLEGRIIEFNPAAQRTFGHQKNQVVGESFIELFILHKDQEQVRASLAHRFSGAMGLLINHRNTLMLLRSSGDQFPAEITVTSANFGRQSDHEFTLHIRDVTRQKKLQSKLQKLAYSDPLTGLSNRTFFLETLEKAIVKCSNQEMAVAVFFLDLDRFKKINDTLGHKAGDDLLLEVAVRLQKITRTMDTIARWGGDEFVILMTGELSVETVKVSAKKILKVMRDPVVLDGRQIKMPTSIGVTLSFDPKISAESLIQQADIAMYSAKQAGRDNYQLFENEMASSTSQQFEREQALRKAMTDLTEFSVVYQPKVDESGQLMGLEALVRWTLADGTSVSPASFIPLAEESNIIIPLEEFVIGTVLKQMEKWRLQEKMLVPVAINLSARHLLSPKLIPFIQSQLAMNQIKGHMIEFEVTEGVFLTDIAKCNSILQELKSMDIKISIDDFGTGYSSLNYLKNLSIDVLKIDRSFINECASSKQAGKICATIVSLADSLELSTVAEGVESQAQFEFLKGIGCKQFQGYYFCRPTSAEDIEMHSGVYPQR
jgi:Amt family ammonium transporter